LIRWWYCETRKRFGPLFHSLLLSAACASLNSVDQRGGRFFVVLSFDDGVAQPLSVKTAQIAIA
jgi:hypothetical protein